MHSSEGCEIIDRISSVCWVDVLQRETEWERLVEKGGWEASPRREMMMLGERPRKRLE